MTTSPKKTSPARKTLTNPSANLRERVLDDARMLKLPLSAETLDAALSRAEQEGLAHLHFLELLLGEPAARTSQRAIERRIRDAKLPEDKSLADFDWKFNAQAIDRAQIEQLATGEFVRRGENLVLVGQSGVGKSFLLQAMAKRFCEMGYRVRYTLATRLVNELVEAADEKQLTKTINRYGRVDLLVIDELGYLPMNRQGIYNLFQLVNGLYEQRSVVLTTNKDFTAWGEFLRDETVAVPIVDRLIHHSHVFMLGGESYRLKQKLVN